MKRRAIFIWMAVFFSPPALAGSKSHGGDTRYPYEGTAWFGKGDRTVKYCVEIDSEFNVNAENVDAEIHHALRTWRSYLEKKLDISTDILRAEVSVKFEKQHSCNGNPDLSFYFGGTPDLVKDQLPHYNDPVAFAYRTEYDMKNSWGKGFIWVTNPKIFKLGRWPNSPFDFLMDWNRPFALRGILLHELGHVFGIEHVEGTIMTENILEFIAAHSLNADVQPGGLADTPLYQIDDRSEILTCSHQYSDCNGDFEYYGKFNPGNRLSEVELVEKLTTQSAGGIVGATVVIKDYPAVFAPKKSDYRLNLTVGASTFVFGVEEISLTIINRNPVLMRLTDYGHKAFKSQKGVVIYGRIKSMNGSFINVVVKHNTHANTPLVFSIIDGTEEKIIFAARSSTLSL
jgi:hypothetical protein